MKQLIYILVLLLLSACANTPQKSDKPILTVTIEPLRYFTKSIAGDDYEVVSMVPKGSSPESYDPTPQQMVALNRSQAYLRIGYIGFEQTWMEKLKAEKEIENLCYNRPELYDSIVGMLEKGANPKQVIERYKQEKINVSEEGYNYGKSTSKK